jgi:hypothetical protein
MLMPNEGKHRNLRLIDSRVDKVEAIAKNVLLFGLFGCRFRYARINDVLLLVRQRHLDVVNIERAAALAGLYV